MEAKLFSFNFINKFISKSLMSLGFLGFASLMGCSGVNPEGQLKNMHSFMCSQGKPAAYVDGYVDGCSTGRRMAGDKKYCYRRNVARADRDALYARGWQDGQICCRNEVLAEQEQVARERAQNSGFFTGNMDDERRRRVEAESRKNDAEIQEIWDQLRK